MTHDEEEVAWAKFAEGYDAVEEVKKEGKFAAFLVFSVIGMWWLFLLFITIWAARLAFE